ncbi:MAG: aminoacylase [Planctomycetaceae bacterium]|nr:MAG: aminoacylase [Planctomycetaceae bacterium]
MRDRKCLSVMPLIVLGMLGLWSRHSVPARADEWDADVLLHGGIVFDGSGAPGIQADVALRHERIVAIAAPGTLRARRMIDCAGMYIAPGFIDLHTHSDQQVVDPLYKAAVNYLLQGCTTQVTGNCGSGPVDVGAYYHKIDEQGAGTNVAHLLPQGTLRHEVMGSEDRRPQPEEMQRMLQATHRAMQDGAWGISTGLIYVPSVYADTVELVSLARVVAGYGGIYVSHIRGEGKELLQAVQEAIQIGREAGSAVHISHIKAAGQEAWGTLRVALDVIEQARAQGMHITADQYPYTASSTSLEATVIPTWARAGGTQALLRRLQAEETTAKLYEEIQQSLERKQGGAAIVLARCRAFPDWVGKNLAQIAEMEGTTPLEIVVQIIRKGGAGVVNFSMSEEDVRLAMQKPWVATASDGSARWPDDDKPHPRSYGTFPRKIGRYAIHEKVLPVEQAIWSATGLPASILRLKERGLIRVNYYADLVVFDPTKFRDLANYEEPHQYPLGVRYVWVNGKPAVWQGIPTGVLAGKALRRNLSEASGASR